MINDFLHDTPDLPDDVACRMGKLQRYMQDISIVLCSRGLDQANLQLQKAMPKELLDRLRLAFGSRLDESTLYSKLGNAKYHVFTPNAKQVKCFYKKRSKPCKNSEMTGLADIDSGQFGLPSTASSSWESAAEQEPAYVSVGDAQHIKFRAIKLMEAPSESEHDLLLQEVRQILTRRSVWSQQLYEELAELISRGRDM